VKKLTLSADDAVIRKVKRLARRNRTSVSAMFGRFVRSLPDSGRAADDVPPDSIAARVTGIISLPKGKTPRDVLTDSLARKYGVGR
jgi:hypothetical protein